MILRTNQTYRARWIFPGAGLPINGGWIRLVGNRLEQLGTGKPAEQSIDLGDVALLPELVNAHTHLEFSDRSQPIGSPGIPLWQWIGQVVAARQGAAERSAEPIVQQGINELLATGTGVTGEIATPPIDYSAIHFGDLATVSFAEVVGLASARYEQR